MDSLSLDTEAFKQDPTYARLWVSEQPQSSDRSDLPSTLVDAAASDIDVLIRICDFLGEAVAAWYSRLSAALRAKRQDRTSSQDPALRAAANAASRDIGWLLDFITRFLRRVNAEGDGSRPVATPQVLTREIIALALKSFGHSDVEYAIGILYLIVQRFQLAEECLKDTLQILSASAMHLQPTPDRVHQCFRVLAEGALAQQTIQVMLDFIAEPTVENKAHELAYARGALRLLQHVVDLRSDDGAWTLDTATLIRSLRIAASQRILRYVADIVNTAHKVLAYEPRRAELPALNIMDLLDLLKYCQEANVPEQEANRATDRHLEDRDAGVRAVGHDIEAAWSALDAQQRLKVCDYALQRPSSISPELLLQCVEFVNQERHLAVDASGWRERIQWMLQHVVRNPDLHPDGRLAAIAALDHTMSLLEMGSHDTNVKEVSETLTGDYKRVLLLQLKSENDKTVLSAISEALIVLARHQECSVYIVADLAQTVVHGLPTKGHRDRNAFYATKALVSIFAETFETAPKIALQAYDGLIRFASLECPFRNARIAAMRILFSLRSTLGGCVYITDDMSAGYIATALCRTRESAEAFDSGVPSFDRRSASSSSMSGATTSTYEPTWMFDDEDNIASPRTSPSKHITTNKSLSKENPDLSHLDVTAWLLELIRILQKDTDWEVYSWVMVNLGSQLANIELFGSSLQAIVMLRQVVCEQINNYKMHEPPTTSGLKKSDVALCLFNILTPLIAYATKKGEVVQKEFGDELVKAFLNGVASQHYEGTARGCIHALSICIFEIPASVASLYPNILERASRSMTQSHLTMHMLEFLSEVASLEELHSNFMQQEVAKMFGMCIQFLERTREQATLSTSNLTPRAATPSRQSGVNLKRPPYRAAMMKDVGVPQYASALAYHTMIRWFLSLRLRVRARLVAWIVPRLIWKNGQGEDMIDEQSEVFIDMMQRTAFSDLGETQPDPSFAKATDGTISSASWVVGSSIVTAETAGHTGITQVIKRQAAGTTYAVYQPFTSKVPSHLAPSNTEIIYGEEDDELATEILPPHVLLQMVSTAAPTPLNDQPISLPHDEFVARALKSFDRIPTVDSHKAGIIYVGPGQTSEADFLMANSGSPDYDRFIQGLGYTVALDSTSLEFNPQGLLHPRDGTSTIAWRDRVTEVVFLIPTMMPPNPDDEPEWLHKKAHVGNCFVNIIFNNSGLHWDFERLRSQLNYINIVITPADAIDDPNLSTTSEATAASPPMPQFYHVQVLTKPGFPNISAAADVKVISAVSLPRFVRVLAINANVFAQCWQTKDTDIEFPSNWRERLQHIKRLKQRMMMGRTGSGSEATPGIGNLMSPPPVPPGSSGGKEGVGEGGRRTPLTGAVGRDGVGGGGRVEGALAKQLDFSRWTS